MPYSNSIANTSTQNTVPVQTNFDVNGNNLGLVGPSGNYFSPPLTSNTITTPTITGGTMSGSAITGGTIASTVANLTTLSVNSNLIASSTLPTIGSGFGTSPTITASNTMAFKIVVGTGGAANGVINFPAAPNGWIAHVADITSSATIFLQQTASTTTSATLVSYSMTTGLAANMTAGDVILITAFAY
jgi:hypothetical protein